MLPMWLPANLLDQMVTIFWNKLENRLIELVISRESGVRCMSTDPQRLSPTPSEDVSPDSWKYKLVDRISMRAVAA